MLLVKKWMMKQLTIYLKIQVKIMIINDLKINILNHYILSLPARTPAS